MVIAEKIPEQHENMHSPPSPLAPYTSYERFRIKQILYSRYEYLLLAACADETLLFKCSGKTEQIVYASDQFAAVFA